MAEDDVPKIEAPAEEVKAEPQAAPPSVPVEAVAEQVLMQTAAPPEAVAEQVLSQTATPPEAVAEQVLSQTATPPEAAAEQVLLRQQRRRRLHRHLSLHRQSARTPQPAHDRASAGLGRAAAAHRGRGQDIRRLSRG